MKVSKTDMLLAGGSAAIWLGGFLAAIWVGGYMGEKLAKTSLVLMFVWMLALVAEGARRDLTGGDSE